MNKTNLCLILTLITIYSSLHSQPKPDSSAEELGILFYNVENLFDTYNDSIKQDEEFLPDGLRHWSYGKYETKLQHISQVIYESGKFNPPAIIGLCEIENNSVLKDLIFKTGLSNLSYHIIHYESDDQRGIDCALLYRANQFIPLESKAIKIHFDKNDRPTRDILYTYGLYKETIPLHLFVCHFPSRYGGIMETNLKRIQAAQTLSDTINSILIDDKLSNIVVMGDFNDNPMDSSINYLTETTKLINLANYPISINKSQGTLKHQFEWNTFDQFLISPNLTDSTKQITACENQNILDFDFLLEDDKKYTGSKPFRTYIGYKYHKGYSDHFPIWLTLYVKE